jgi:hypothetical protein
VTTILGKHLVSRLTAFVMGAALAQVAGAAFPPTNSIVVAVRRGDCLAAVRLLNPEVRSNDMQTAFLAGRLLDEGICVQQDPAAAAHYFAHAAQLGDKDAALDFAAKVGLGEGTDQDYERAGELCRAAGFDPEHRVSSYSLGYACTLRGASGKLLRQSLPAGAFQPMPGAAILVQFMPATEQMRVLKTPHVGSQEAAIGAWISRPLINATVETEKAWQSALAMVPRPDGARLGSEPVELPLDVDLTLELPLQKSKTQERQSFQPRLFQSDIHGTTVAH